jgi:hypothetical protein
MMLAISLRSFALPSLLALCGGEHPRFAPDPGSTLHKTFREELQLELTDCVKSIDGKELPRTDGDMTMKGVRELAVTDEYLALADGRAERLRRRFGALRTTLAVRMDEKDPRLGPLDLSGRSELEDTAVLFQLDGEECTASFETGKDERTPDDAVLAGLREDMDLRVCLPSEEVEEGDSWDIDPAAFASVLAPGGALEFDYPGASDIGAKFALIFAHMFVGDAAEKSSGNVKATWLSTREVDGRTLGRIELEIDVQCAADLLGRARAGAEASGKDATWIEGFRRLELASTWKGTGHVEWDMAAGRIHGSSLEGVLSCNLSIENQLGGEPTTVFESAFDFEGKSKLTLVTESP